MRAGSLFDLDHPFFRPLWRRIAVTALVGGWAVLELVTGSPFWAVIFGALAFWCARSFFGPGSAERYRDD
ncbi:MAG: hypothetical protein D6754_04470 [Alphaproteobacteria bacterium]|nr:MAG: hypothetical protein D6754_04470 [Alphaproteobacteria bacterium]